MKGNEESINAIANGSCGDVHKKNYISLHRIFNLVGGKTMEEYKRKISALLERIQSEAMMRRIYLIITTITGS